jgi:hypothetical protein
MCWGFFVVANESGADDEKPLPDELDYFGQITIKKEWGSQGKKRRNELIPSIPVRLFPLTNKRLAKKIALSGIKRGIAFGHLSLIALWHKKRRVCSTHQQGECCFTQNKEPLA